VTNPHEPDFGLWMLRTQPIRSGKRGVAYRIGTGLDVDRNDLAIIARLYLRPHLSLIDFVATAGSLFG